MIQKQIAGDEELTLAMLKKERPDLVSALWSEFEAQAEALDWDAQRVIAARRGLAGIAPEDTVINLTKDHLKGLAGLPVRTK